MASFQLVDLFTRRIFQGSQVHHEEYPTVFVKEMWFSGEILLNLARNFSAAFLLACFYDAPFPVSINDSSLQIVVYSLLWADPPSWERKYIRKSPPMMNSQFL